jgi:hypothetical protein
MKLNAKTAALFVIFAAGCAREGESIDPPGRSPLTAAEVTQTVEARVGDHVREIDGTLRALADSELAEELGLVATEPEPGEDPAGEIAREVSARLFAQDSVEQSSATEIVYRVLASRVCGDETLDPDCVRVLDRVPVRLVVRSPLAGALSITVEMGQARHHPLTIELAADRASVELDLAAAKASFDEVAAVLQLDTEGLPTSAVGRLSIAMIRNAAEDFTFELRILDDLQVVSMSPTYALHVEAKSSPVASVRLDGGASSADVNVDFAAIDLAAPGNVFGDLFDINGIDSIAQIRAHLAGASGSGTFTGEEDRLELRNIGLGDERSSVIGDGVELFGIDLNPTHGRRLDLTLSANPSGGVSVRVSPAAEVVVGLSWGILLDRGAEAPEWTRSEVFRATLDGASSPEIIFDEGLDGVLARVGAGTLRVSADVRGAAVTVSEGQCLMSIEGSTDETHPIDALLSGMCR